VLYILISKETPLGWVRQMVHNTVCQLAELITNPSIKDKDPVSFSDTEKAPSGRSFNKVAS
jgi:hypothetical protein